MYVTIPITEQRRSRNGSITNGQLAKPLTLALR